MQWGVDPLRVVSFMQREQDISFDYSERLLP